MTRASTTHTWSASTAALYVSTFQPISTMLRSVLTQTTDTGQVNFAAVTTIPGSATIRDYEMYRLTDSLQATAPVFVRLDYGNNGTAPSIQVTVGTTTDGAGNLGGVTAARTTLNATSSPTLVTAATQTSYVSTDGSQIVIFGNLVTTGTATGDWIGTVIERFRNSDGTPNAEGYNAWHWGNYAANSTAIAAAFSRVIASGATQPAMEYNPPVLVPLVLPSSTYLSGSTVYAFPFFTNGPLVRGPSQAVMYGLAADYPRCTETLVPYTGMSKKYLALGSAAAVLVPYTSGAANNVSGKTGYTPLFRWE